jgi:hypothetical protein
MLALDLNDAGIRAARAGDDAPVAVDGPHASSPGCARVRRQRTLATGLDAERQRHLHPLEVSDRFWDRLDTEPVHPGDPRSPNRAEVACAHLDHVLRTARRPGEEVVVAVPPTYDERQLGLLAGIARELDVPLRALVARPVAIDAQGPDDAAAGPVLVVELGLHRCVLSTVVADEGGTRLARTRVVPDVGLDAFHRQWMRAIGGEFIRATRFDPAHDAATEQQLRDRLPAVLDAVLADGTHALELDAGGPVHRVTVTDQVLAHAGHDLLARACAEIRDSAAASGAAALVLAHDAARIPGLARTAGRQTALPVRGLDADAAARGLAALWPDGFEPAAAEGVAWHTRRRRAGVPSIDAAPPAPRPHPDA